MLKTWRRLMTVKLLALSAVGLVGIVAVVGIGFWHRRQLDVDVEGHSAQRAGRGRPHIRPFTVPGERAEQDAYRGEGSYSRGEFAGGPDID
jgi:hypothetical protein